MSVSKESVVDVTVLDLNDEIDQLKQRISKAKEILERYSRVVIWHDADDIVREAMTALEGK